jgi:hypothetical protein
MQILHPFAGSIQHYLDQIADPNRYRPDHCPQCGAKRPLTGHGFYCRTLVDVTFNGVLRIRRYLPSKWTRSCENRKRCAAIHPMDSSIPRVLETKFAAGSRRCPGVSSGTRARLRAGACF